MVGRRELNALPWFFGGVGNPWRQFGHQKKSGKRKDKKMIPIRSTFRVELKVRVRRTDGSTSLIWMAMPDPYDGQNIECALAHAVDKAAEEVRRISRRPKYDLVGVLGADYHVLNVRFVRMDVEDEDGEG
jgi:hypothetical protein